MNCPHCNASAIRTLKQTTILGYEQYYCRSCCSQFNERTGTAFNFIEYRTEVVMLAVYYYFRFKVSLDDVVELMSLRGFHLSHQTIHNWVQWFGPSLGIQLRKRRYKKNTDKWHVDATYIRVEGRWVYFYRAIDNEGNLVDVYLSDVRDKKAAKAFFRQAAKTTGIYPEEMISDKEPALYPAIDETFGDYTTHRDNKFLNNPMEQSHRGVQSRTEPMKGFKNPFCALCFCTVFEEIKQFFRMKNKTRAEKRRLFASRFRAFHQLATNAA